MKCLVVSYATDHNDKGLKALVNSLQKYRWEYEILGEGDTWQGFGSKLLAVKEGVYRWREAGYTNIIFVDAYDVLCNRPYEYFKEEFHSLSKNNAPFVYSAELNCWPDAHLANSYPTITWLPDCLDVGNRKGLWRYLNSGSYLVPLKNLDDVQCVYEDITPWVDDQRHMTKRYLEERIGVLDVGCKLFQSIAFCHPWEDFFTMCGGVLYNKVTGSCPYFIHGNGKTDMSWVK